MDSKPGSRTWISPITSESHSLLSLSSFLVNRNSLLLLSFIMPLNYFFSAASYCNTTDCDNAGNDKHMSFSDLGLSEWMVRGCDKLGMQSPRPVQRHCIPKVLEGRHVIGIDKTGSGKTAAFALPILQRLGETPFGVFALVLTPTRELAVQLAHQFWILGSSLRLILTVVVGGLDKRIQAKQLVARPNLVIATPERLKILLQDNPEIAPIFAATKVIMIMMNLVNILFLLKIGLDTVPV